MSALPERVDVARERTTETGVQYRRRRRRQSGERPERYVATLAMTVLGTAIMALWIGGHATLTVTGYRLSHLKTELSTVQQTNRVLSTRAALLADPGRIIADAGKLPMTRALPSETFYVAESEASAPSASRPHGAVVTIAMNPRP